MTKKNNPIKLTGGKPLWSDFEAYIDFITEHKDEVYTGYLLGDENASLIVDMIFSYHSPMPPPARGVLMVAVERYINDYYPDIAVIANGYPKLMSQRHIKPAFALLFLIIFLVLMCLVVGRLARINACGDGQRTQDCIEQQYSNCLAAGNEPDICATR